MDFIKSEERRLVGGIVYQPDTIDADGDYTDAEEIRKAAEGWMLDGHVLKLQHETRAPDTALVECFIAEAPTKKGGQIIPVGAWYICCKVLNDKLWKQIKDGQVSGFSMAGEATTSEE